MPSWTTAGLAGVLVGSALFLGALVGWLSPVGHQLVAAAMNFGSGVLIALISFELLEPAFRHGGPALSVGGFLAGSVAFSGINAWLSSQGAKHRKRCSDCNRQPSERQLPGSGLAIAIGTLLDGTPESVVIGLDALSEDVGMVVIAGFFVANFPQGLSGAGGMKGAGRSRRYVLGVWGGLAVLSGLMPIAGVLLFQDSSLVTISVASSCAAGAALAMVTETMIPEAFHHSRSFGGIIIAVGFGGAFLLSHALP